MINWKSLSLGLWLACSVAQADTTSKITIKELEKQGVFSRNFSIYHVADDGRTVLAADEPPFNIKKKGILNRLWLIRLNSDLKLDSMQAFDLSVPQIEQANFTPDLKSVVLSSKRGADIYRLDLGDGKLTTLMTHTKGNPGFRIHSDVFATYLGKIYTIGYFYDAEDNCGPEQMVELDPATGKCTTVVELEPIQKQLQGIRVASLRAPVGLTFYTQDKAKNWAVHRWNTSGLAKVDEGKAVTGSWGEGPVAVYCMRRPEGKSELVLSNAQTGERKVLHSDSQDLLNPVISKEATTVVVAKETSPDVCSYWVGQEQDQFALRSLVEKMPRAAIRISHDGRVVSLYHGLQGWTLIKLDSK
jgi:hypothetical protein